MPERRSFLLRCDPAVLEAIQNWADDDLRSLNGQIEFLLRRCLIDARRVKPEAKTKAEAEQEAEAEAKPKTGEGPRENRSDWRAW